jgi:uncharacterized protein YkwD
MKAPAARVAARLTARTALNPHRRERTYPRAVKRSRHNQHRVKQATDTGTRHTAPPTIRFFRAKQPTTTNPTRST